MDIDGNMEELKKLKDVISWKKVPKKFGILENFIYLCKVETKQGNIQQVFVT
jgi:hypothetical protein